ncbi:hypothetical protein BDK51DRAFT_50692, partial [Blyttiomyces helicus]
MAKTNFVPPSLPQLLRSKTNEVNGQMGIDYRIFKPDKRRRASMQSAAETEKTLAQCSNFLLTCPAILPAQVLSQANGTDPNAVAIGPVATTDPPAISPPTSSPVPVATTDPVAVALPPAPSIPVATTDPINATAAPTAPAATTSAVNATSSPTASVIATTTFANSSTIALNATASPSTNATVSPVSLAVVTTIIAPTIAPAMLPPAPISSMELALFYSLSAVGLHWGHAHFFLLRLILSRPISVSSR